MRLLTIFVIVLGVAPAWAKPPKVAVVNSGKAAGTLGEAFGNDATIVHAKVVVKALAKLKLSGEIDDDDAARLDGELGTTVIVQGKLGKDDGKQTLHVKVFVKGKKATGFTVQFDSLKSTKLRASLHDELIKKINAADEDDDDRVAKKKKDDNDERVAKKRKDDDDDRVAKKRKDDDDNRVAKKKKQDDDERSTRKKKDDDDDGKKKKVASKSQDDDNEDDGPRKRKHHKADEEVGAAMRNAVFADAGVSFGLRQLQYNMNASGGPPAVGKPGAGSRFEAEVYPFALGDRKSAGAGLGFAADYDRGLGISIAVPAGGSATIDAEHFSVGARYRIAAGRDTSVTLGASYAQRKYVADRSSLSDPKTLDMPDVDYQAVVPSIGVRTPVASSATLYANAGALLILSAGDISKASSYGAATVYGADLSAGVDIAMSANIALRLAAEVDQIMLSFKGVSGTMSSTRGVNGATDRTIGGIAALAVTY